MGTSATGFALRRCLNYIGPTSVDRIRTAARFREGLMRIAVVGAGGVGGGFGAALAKAGADVTFIARGAHLAAMKSDGLRVNSPRGDTHLVPTQATDDPASIGKVDVVLFCVKLWDVESAGEHIKPLVGSATAVIPLQNGIDAADRLLPILGRDAVMGGVAQISASIIKPGVINQVGIFMRMIFGELDGKVSKRGEALLALCQKAGFDVTLSEQILTDLWMKFILLATNASITASTRQPIGKLRDDPDIHATIVAAVREVHAIGRAKGIALPADAAEKVLEFIGHAPPAMKASMALDLERGNRLELPWLGGKVVELGRELGVPTPVHSTMYALLKPYIMGATG
jgi:2-dehydropantoate 2-reductase